MSQEATSSKLQPLSSEEGEKVYIIQNMMVGAEPDNSDKEYEIDDDVFTRVFTDSAASDSEPDVNPSSSDIPPAAKQTLIPAERPLLASATDVNGQRKERTSIFSNEAFEVRKSSVAGWGAFARKKLQHGDCILVEEALYHATHENVQRSVQELSERDRELANDLHAFYSRPEEPKEEAIWNTNAFATKLPCKPTGDGAGPTGYQNMAGLFPVASRFNHSCEPKVGYRYLVEQQVLVMTVRALEIDEGEELTISYCREPSVLWYRFGFNCGCGYCRGFDPSEEFW